VSVTRDERLRSWVASKRLRILAAASPDGSDDSKAPQIRAAIRELSRPAASRTKVQACVSRITGVLLRATFIERRPEQTLLIPILRAGLAMWGAANAFLGHPATCFVHASKVKSSTNVVVSCADELDRIDQTLSLIVVLDTIVANGDTAIAVCRELESVKSRDCAVTLLSCYAAPDGVDRVLRRTRVSRLAVGCLADGVDGEGYLIPPTRGDLGDKLFGVSVRPPDRWTVESTRGRIGYAFGVPSDA